MSFKHTNEGYVAGKTAGKGNLLDAHLGIYNQLFCKIDSFLVDELYNTYSILGLHGRGEIGVTQMQLFSNPVEPQQGISEITLDYGDSTFSYRKYVPGFFPFLTKYDTLQ